MQNNEGFSFVGMNLLTIAVIGLLMFVYLVFLIRKRWKKGFLHDRRKEE